MFLNQAVYTRKIPADNLPNVRKEVEVGWRHWVTKIDHPLLLKTKLFKLAIL